MEMSGQLPWGLEDLAVADQGAAVHPVAALAQADKEITAAEDLHLPEMTRAQAVVAVLALSDRPGKRRSAATVAMVYRTRSMERLPITLAVAAVAWTVAQHQPRQEPEVLAVAAMAAIRPDAPLNPER